jgi:hypothetical protein
MKEKAMTQDNVVPMPIKKTEYAAGHFLEHLKERFEMQAEWRREKAQQYPDDVRNLDAAETFDKLAATCRDVSPQWARAYEKLWDGEHFEYAAEEENDMVSSINIAYANAEEFIKELVETVSER